MGLKRRRLAAAYRAADAVVAVSAQAAKSAESYYGLDPGSVLVIKNPVDLERLTQSAERPSPEQDQPSRDRDRTRLVCVGRMTEEKGHADLLVALASVRDRWPITRQPFSIRLVGEGPLRLALQSQTRTLRLTEQVTFVGALPDAAGEIAGADALVLPSRFEGMPNVVLEAMALGTPVIATRAGGTVALQRDQPTAFWAQPGDAQSIADAILQFAREPQTAEKQRDAALDLILAEHDVNTIVRQIEDLLDPPAP